MRRSALSALLGAGLWAPFHLLADGNLWRLTFWQQIGIGVTFGVAGGALSYILSPERRS